LAQFTSYHEADHNQPTLPPVDVPMTTDALIDKYVAFISDKHCTWGTVNTFAYYENIERLLQYTFCIPATSALWKGSLAMVDFSCVLIVRGLVTQYYAN
jgi:hypothetical protein